MSAIEFGNLTEVAKIVICQFVQHLGERDGAKFGVLAGARPRCGGNRVEVENERAAERDKFFQILSKGLLLKFRFRERLILRDRGGILEHDAARALLV